MIKIEPSDKMPISFKIISSCGLALVRLSGRVELDDCVAAAASYARYAEARASHNLLIDLSRVTGYEPDYVKILHAIGKIQEYLWHPGSEPLVVCLASTPVSQRISVALDRVISGLPGVIGCRVSDESHALDILGLPERNIDDLLLRSARQA